MAASNEYVFHTDYFDQRNRDVRGRQEIERENTQIRKDTRRQTPVKTVQWQGGDFQEIESPSWLRFLNGCMGRVPRYYGAKPITAQHLQLLQSDPYLLHFDAQDGVPVYMISYVNQRQENVNIFVDIRQKPFKFLLAPVSVRMETTSRNPAIFYGQWIPAQRMLILDDMYIAQTPRTERYGQLQALFETGVFEEPESSVLNEANARIRLRLYAPLSSFLDMITKFHAQLPYTSNRLVFHPAIKGGQSFSWEIEQGDTPVPVPVPVVSTVVEKEEAEVVGETTQAVEGPIRLYIRKQSNALESYELFRDSGAKECYGYACIRKLQTSQMLAGIFKTWQPAEPLPCVECVWNARFQKYEPMRVVYP